MRLYQIHIYAYDRNKLPEQDYGAPTITLHAIQRDPESCINHETLHQSINGVAVV